MGYSTKINDPAFDKYIVDTNRWSAMFSCVLAVIAVAGFFIYGEINNEMDNPQASFIGLAIGSMFILIALYHIISRNRDRTWDGYVSEKSTKKKQRTQNTSEVYEYAPSYGRGAYSITFTYEGESDDYYDPPYINGESYTIQAN